MPSAASARLALTAPVAADPNNVPADVATLITQLEARAAGFLDGLFAARPAAAAGNARFFYWATDALALFRSDGAAWSPVGGIQAMTTAQRDGLVAGGKWTGRVIENTTTAQLERWTGAAWAAVGVAVVTTKATRTTGDVTLNDNSGAFVSNVDTGLDLTIPAAVGDVIRLQFAGFLGSEAINVAFDFVTRVAGADVNFVSSGTPVPFANGIPGSRVQASVQVSMTCSTDYTAQAGDIAAGNIVFRLRYWGHTTGNRTLSASAGINVRVSAANLRH